METPTGIILLHRLLFGFEKNYIVWKHFKPYRTVLIVKFEKNYIVWKHGHGIADVVAECNGGLRRTI